MIKYKQREEQGIKQAPRGIDKGQKKKERSLTIFFLIIFFSVFSYLNLFFIQPLQSTDQNFIFIFERHLP